MAKTVVRDQEESLEYEGRMNNVVDAELVAYLVCGRDTSGVTDLCAILDRLRETISSCADELLRLSPQSSSDMKVIPYYARALLEASCTALITRQDPFRTLILYRLQKSQNYDLSRRSNIAVQWSGDVISANKPKPDLWHPDHKANDYDRALLGQYTVEVYWKPAFTSLMDSGTLDTSSPWFSSIASLDEKSYFESVKGQMGALFSTFSKFVHQEILLQGVQMFDAITAKDSVARLIQTVASLGLLSQFCGLFCHRLTPQETQQSFLRLEDVVENGYKSRN